MMQPKRQALLAYLTVSGRGFATHRRDALVALFWPELDEGRARAALSRAVYYLRHELGEDAILSRGDQELGINPDRVSCDATEFLRLVGDRQLEDALDLYRGEFLRGFHVAGAPGFEEWLDAERRRLQQLAAGAARELASEAGSNGHHQLAVRFARQAVDLAPYDEVIARSLISHLAAAGDRAGAIRESENLTARLVRDLEVEPSAETVALVERIRIDQGTPRSSRADAPRGDAPEALSSAAAGNVDAARSGSGNRPAWVMPSAMLAVAIVVLAAFWVSRVWRDPVLASQVANPKSIAVLPFESLSDDPEDVYFADGVHEDILTHLSKIRDLKVISRTSVMRYRVDRQNVRQIGHELGVATILEGSVRRARERIRITAQLIDARTDEQLWAENFDREITDIFEIQTEVAQRIVAALRLNLTAGEQARIETTPTTNAQAYDYYLQAREYQFRAVIERQDLVSAEELYLRAVAVDPEFALAYARLAEVHLALYWYAHDRSEERLLRARSMVDESLRLQADLPEAHFAAGLYHYWAERDYKRAQAEIEIALAALPGSAEMYATIGYVQRRSGEWEAAADRLRRAAELDPRNANTQRNLAETLELMRQYREANSFYTGALDLTPDLHLAALQRAFVFLRWQGTTDSVRAVLDRLPAEFEPTLGAVPVAPRVHLALLTRDPEEALRLLATSPRDLYEHQRYYYPASLLAAFAHSLRGDSLRANAAYDSARLMLDAALVSRPDDARIHSALGFAYAGLGRKAEAVRAGRRAVEILPVSTDALDGAVFAIELAAIYAAVGDTANAVTEIERLLQAPAGLSIHELRLDPRWDSLRQAPAFMRLVTL